MNRYFFIHMEEILKEAEEKKSKPPTTAGIIGRGIAGLTLGTIGGYGLGKAVEAIARRQGVSLHRAIPPIVGTAGAGLGITYPLWKMYENEGIRQAREAKHRALLEKQKEPK